MMCGLVGGKGDVPFDNLSSVPRTILKHRCSETHGQFQCPTAGQEVETDRSAGVPGLASLENAAQPKQRDHVPTVQELIQRACSELYMQCITNMCQLSLSLSFFFLFQGGGLLSLKN